MTPSAIRAGAKKRARLRRPEIPFRRFAVRNALHDGFRGHRMEFRERLMGTFPERKNFYYILVYFCNFISQANDATYFDRDSGSGLMDGRDERTLSAGGARMRPLAMSALNYKPSVPFSKYCQLLCSLRFENSAVKCRILNLRRSELAEDVAAHPADNLGQILEKLYVWRMEFFGLNESDPDESDRDDPLCYDEIFPLSAYLELKRLIPDFKAPEIFADQNHERLFEAFRSVRKEGPGDDENVIRLFKRNVEEEIFEAAVSPGK